MNNEEIVNAYKNLEYYSSSSIWSIIGEECHHNHFPVKEIDDNYDYIIHPILVDDSITKLHSCLSDIGEYLESFNPLFYLWYSLINDIRGKYELPDEINQKLDRIQHECAKLTGFKGIESKLYRSTFNYNNRNPEAPEYLLKLCIKAIREYKDSIKQIIHNNPRVSNYTLDVVQLIAPVIAQNYAGIPALAVVGSIILLCKQGINKIIDS